MNKKMFYAILALVVILAFTFAAPSSANAWWKFRNKTDKTIYVCIARWEGDHWESKGWWKIDPGCEAKVLDRNLNEKIEHYFYANSPDDDYIWTGDKKFQASTDSFWFTYADEESDHPFTEYRIFRKISVNPDNHTTNLTVD